MIIQSILFDVDGVLIDVSESYDAAIIATAEAFGVSVNRDQILELRTKPGTNNDWDLTYLLVQKVETVNRADPEYAKIKSKFQELFLGTNFNGLITKEKLIITTETLDALSKKYKLGIVSSRPRAELVHSLNQFIPTYFNEQFIVAQEDCEEEKPSSKPIQLVLERMSVSAEEALYLGDTVNDREAARAAGTQYLHVPSDLTDVNQLPSYLEQAKLLK